MAWGSINTPNWPKGKKVKVEVHSVISSGKHHSPDFTQCELPRHRTCSFISHLNSPGSIRPAATCSTRNYSNTQAITVLPGTPLLLGQESACGQSALPRSTSEHTSAQLGDRTCDLSLTSCACNHRATAPHMTTEVWGFGLGFWKAVHWRHWTVTGAMISNFILVPKYLQYKHWW